MPTPQGNVTLVRPDGTKVVIPAAEAEKLRTLQYREQTPREEMEEGISRGVEKYYTSPEQKWITAGQGLASGMTLGLSDLRAKDADQQRARFNPGIRMGTELLGSLVTMHPSMSMLPGGLLTTAAKEGAEALKLGKVGTAVVRAGIEGAGYGGAGAITNAQLNGDPLTAETIGAGMGWGAIFGGGLGALGGAVEARFEARAARKLAAEEAKFTGIGAREANALERAEGRIKVAGVLEEGMKGEHKALNFIEDEGFAHVTSAIRDASDTLKKARATIVGDVERVAPGAPNLNFADIKNSQLAIKSQLTENYLMKDAGKLFSRAQVELAIAQAAAKEGKYEKMVSRLDKFKEHMVAMETTLGGPKFFNSEKAVGQASALIKGAEEYGAAKVAHEAALSADAKLRLRLANEAAEGLAHFAAVQGTLEKFPKNVDELAALTSKKVEKLAGAIDSFGKIKAAELSGIQEAVQNAVGMMGEQLGVRLEGSTGKQFSGMWKILKENRTKRAEDAIRMATESNLLWGKADKAAERLSNAKMAGDVAKEAARKKGHGEKAVETFLKYNVGKAAAQKFGSPGYLIGSGLVTGLIGLKGAILGTIVEQAEKWLPKAARGVQKYGARVEPLARRIDGNPEDTSGKTRQELMAQRSKEILEAAPGVRDTLYKGIAPLVTEHPELAAELHAQQVARFQFVLSKLPKDPGLAFSNLKSIWKPDSLATEKFARYYEVFHDPVGVMVRALKTGKITLEAAEGLREMNPELWQTLRVHMLERISSPEVAGKMKYEDQVHVGMLLGLNLHSTMTPHFISAQQQMYTERNQPLEMNPRIQPGGGAGRPSGPGPQATSAQRTTEH